MFVKFVPVSWKVLAVLFTSIAAPLSVQQISGNLNPAPASEVVFTEPPAEPAPATLPATIRVVAQGSGLTPDAAFQNALETAMQQAMMAEVSTSEWALHGRVYLALIRHNGNGLLRGWRELSSGSERHLTGRTYKSEVAIELDGEALRERLHLARPK
ncbi:MAG TPA: hypothetical protein VH092_36415 [Urbifossiella sp.]|nr:hypothetical protein [Urbifossiella sp.]